MKQKTLLLTVLIAALLISSGMAVREKGREQDHAEQRQHEGQRITVRSSEYHINVAAHSVSINLAPSNAGFIIVFPGSLLTGQAFSLGSQRAVNLIRDRI
jgi:hypothetical protein